MTPTAAPQGPSAPAPSTGSSAEAHDPGRDPAVEIQNLSHAYGDRVALERITLSVNAGEVFALLGPNGGGKSTLFRILTTLMRATGDGAARVCGHDVRRAPAAVRACIGVTFQSPSLDLKLTVRENLRIHGHLYGLSGRALRDRIDELLQTFTIAERAADRVEVLSGGLRRRVEIAKSLIHRPRILLLDEPSTGLDPAARRDLQTVFRDLSQNGITVFLTTHLMDEAECSSRVAILDRELVAVGRPDELRSAVGGEIVSFETPDPRGLAAFLTQRFPDIAPAIDGDKHVRVEHPAGHKFLVSVIDAFPGRIDAVHVGKPTLADVFIHHTGRRFDRESAPAAVNPRKRR